ncbi:MAG: DEAD/DEAH box helicase [Desulfitobacterium sp.]
MNIKEMIQNLGGKITYDYIDCSRPGKYMKAPEILDTRLRLYTKFKYPQGLYSHQVMCINSLLNGQHTALCTSTASGKSLGFCYPAMQEILNNSNARALFVYPIKALANDQIAKLKSLAADLGLKPDIVRKFDGDVKATDRVEALEKSRILVVTPDVLHTTLLRLNDEPLYSRFFENLALVILDECHTYSGVFGSNMAYVLSRLRQVCQKKGSNPRFMMSSATVGNPQEHLRQLTGIEDITIIDERFNGSPQFEREFFMVQPTRYQESYTLDLMGELIQQNTRFLVFGQSRQQIERLVENFRLKHPKYRSKVEPYRAGFTPTERQQIENSFRKGELVGLVATSALELGVDLPNLSVCIILGLPSTKSSFWQQSGRIGRSSEGVVIVLRTDSAYDNYFFSNPEKLYNEPFEPLVINQNNEPLMIGHYACARAESGDFENPFLDHRIFGSKFSELNQRIKEFDYSDEILYTKDPHFEINIRSLNDPTYQIVIGRDSQDPPIGTITYSQLMREAYPQAIFLQRGRRYRVTKISFTNKKVYVDARCPMYSSTRPRGEVHIKERFNGRILQKNWGSGVTIRNTTLGILEKVSGYQIITGKEKEDVEYAQPLMRYFVTQGVIIHLKDIPSLSHSAVVGLTTALHNIYPVFYPCAKEDIASYAWAKEGEAGIFLYDNNAGGLGLTTAAFDQFEELIGQTYENIANCEYCLSHPQENGCINCVVANRWYTTNVKSDRHAVLRLFEEIINLLQRILPQSNQDGSENLPAKSLLIKEGHFGRTMISDGSLVFTGKNQEGVVLSSLPFQSVGEEERLYELNVQGQIVKFMGRSLTLVQGNLEYWCTNCGQEGIERSEEFCPLCGSLL